jgi:hypothetical protein
VEHQQQTEGKKKPGSKIISSQHSSPLKKANKKIFELQLCITLVVVNHLSLRLSRKYICFIKLDKRIIQEARTQITKRIIFTNRVIRNI